jgi:hypothetical protein
MYESRTMKPVVIVVRMERKSDRVGEFVCVYGMYGNITMKTLYNYYMLTKM